MTMKSLNQSPSRLPCASVGLWVGEASSASQEISLWTWFFTAMVRNVMSCWGKRGANEPHTTVCLQSAGQGWWDLKAESPGSVT